MNKSGASNKTSSYTLMRTGPSHDTAISHDIFDKRTTPIHAVIGCVKHNRPNDFPSLLPSNNGTELDE